MGSPSGVIRPARRGRGRVLSVEIPSDVAVYDFSGIRGEYEGYARLRWFIKNGSGGDPQLDLRPNGANPANMKVNRFYNGGPDALTYLDMGTGFGSGYYSSGEATFDLRIGQARMWHAKYAFGVLGSNPAIVVLAEGHWNDTTTPITNLVVHGSLTATIKAGSRLSLELLAAAPW